jgi:cell volume regulation protein A
VWWNGISERRPGGEATLSEVEHFGLVVGAVGLVAMLAVLSNRLSEWIRVPAPAFFLIGAAVASDLAPSLGHFSTETMQRIVTVALIVLLFDGGMHIGLGRFRSAAGAVVWLGTAGTFVTAGALAALAHVTFGFGWQAALLIGTALAPTDPAVVFSVLGKREVVGRAGVLLEGESGANDPVGIALMVGLVGVTAGTSAGAEAGSVALDFVVQMLAGAAVGVLGGLALLAFMRRVPLPSEGLYPLRTLAGAGVIYGLATAAQGSGFLAVFVAGILIGDERAPFKREIERFHASLASLSEIVAFTVLGLSVSLRSLPTGHAWQIGLALAAMLAFVVRPLLVGALLAPVRLNRGERIFVLWAGLKGAVPILLGTFVLTAGNPDGTRIYGIIFVVVAFSVIVQGGLVPTVAARAGVRMRQVEPQPWASGLRFRTEPEGLHHYVVQAGSLADGHPVGDLPLGEDMWISLVSRDGHLVQVRGATVLRAGDEVLALGDPDDWPSDLFTTTAAPAAPDRAGAQADNPPAPPPT